MQVNIVVEGETHPNEVKTLAFRLAQDADTINVYANDTLVGWFEVDNGKVLFGKAFISDADADFISTTGGELTVY